VSDREELLAGIKAKGVVHGDFVLSSGQHATSYVDLRRVTLDGRLAPLVGRVLLNATAGLSYDAVGGLTLGADPVATAMLHAAANRSTPIDAFVVRKAEKTHGLQRRIEGPGPRWSALPSSSIAAPGRRSSTAACPTSRSTNWPSSACKT
jgi:orotate phosphoribosyltransferase